MVFIHSSIFSIVKVLLSRENPPPHAQTIHIVNVKLVLLIYIDARHQTLLIKKISWSLQQFNVDQIHGVY